MHTVLQARGLVKDFGDHKGVFDIDITLQPGKVVGFVGPNGAGKSTAINMLTGLTKPNSGTIKIFGKPHDYRTIYKLAPRLGVMYSELTLDDSLTAAQVFTQSQELLGKDCSAQWQAMSKKLELALHKPIKKLSLGNKKKVGVVHALMHQPELIIMDEPTSGLDPIIRERFAALIKQAAADGATVLLSSHDLGEVQEVSDRVVMIKAGKIILDDQTDKILNLAQRTFQLVQPPSELVEALKKLPGLDNIKQTQTQLSFEAKDYELVIKVITSAGFYNFYVEKPNLEGSFREYYE